MRDASCHVGGYVRLYRSLLSWEWFQDSSTLHVFLFLLLSACFRPTQHAGVSLAPGQLITARRQIAARTGLSEQQVRTALEHLKSTREITIQPSARFSVITINNFTRYQGLLSPGISPGSPPSASPPSASLPPKNKPVNPVNHVNQEKKKGVFPHEPNDRNDGNAGGVLSGLGVCL